MLGEMLLTSALRAGARRGLVPACAALAVAGLAPAAARAAVQGSTNWAGYVATHSGSFRSVSGTWVVPAVNCQTVRPAYSANWVGLGGYRAGASALEQVGTESDCGPGGRAEYGAWWEILPAAPAAIRLALHPGDTVTASATVAGHAVTLRLRDLTTGARYSTTRHAAQTDVSSAEWIVEAPSVCRSSSECTALALADFGTTGFTAATATAYAITAPAGAWPLTTLELQQEYLSRPSPGTPRARTLLTAETSAVGALGAFTVAWRLQTAASAPGGPTLPGFSG